MAARENYYQQLGVPSTASTDEIRNSYRDKALQQHPDRGGDPLVWANVQRAYDTLSDMQKRAMYDKSGDEVSGGTEKQFAQGFAEGGGVERKGMNIVKQMEEAKQSGSTLAAAGFNMSHNDGFEAWQRNQKGLGKSGFFTAEDLLRKRGIGGIEATDDTAQELPKLTTTAVRFDKHGLPEEVLYVDNKSRLPEKLAHGEVLVHMLAACVNDEDLLRVQTPLTILNDFPPFNRTNNKWEEVELPATAGVEGVGVVIATARNVPTLKDGALEVKDWVIAKPEARLKPIGCFATLCVCDASQLLKVPSQLMPLQHLACSRSLCTAYRMLEDYGGLRPGDTIIQNAADLPVGQAVIQLCKMLKIRSINLVGDDDGFERTKELLMELGASYVLRDNAKLAEFISSIGHMMPRLAIDALGGEAGRRMMIALRPGGSLVMHSLQTGQVPSMSPSLLMYQQVSLHGFNLAQWVDENGCEAYLHTLRTIAGLIQADKLNIFARSLSVADLNAATLVEALKSHRAVQDASTFRERTILVFGDESAANEVYFELQASIRNMMGADDDDDLRPARAAPSAVAPTAAKPGLPRASERWADAKAMLKDIKLEQYVEQFEEEEMTSMELLEEIVGRGDGEKELMDALKEMGIKKMGHRQTIVGAIVGKL